MAWRTLFISRPARLSCRNRQLLLKDEEGEVRIPLEDLAAVVIESPQVTLTAAWLSQAAEQGLTVVICGPDHLPNGIFTAFHRHSRQARVEREQAGWSEPFKKRLRQTIVRNKVFNQAYVLAFVNKERSRELMEIGNKIQSGDSGNREAAAAALYFRHLFETLDSAKSAKSAKFTRERVCVQNAALNYGYAVIRAAAARAAVAHGFIPSRGIFHRSELNAFNLADDIMEPYRPAVDEYVLRRWPVIREEELTRQDKGELVGLLYREVMIAGETMYLLNALEAAVKSLGAAGAAKDPRLYQEVNLSSGENG